MHMNGRVSLLRSASSMHVKTTQAMAASLLDPTVLLASAVCCAQVAQLQGEAREVVHLRGQLADKESEVAGLRAHLEEALREELADSDPARLRAAQKRAAALEADLAAKQVLPHPSLQGEP